LAKAEDDEDWDGRGDVGVGVLASILKREGTELMDMSESGGVVFEPKTPFLGITEDGGGVTSSSRR